MKKLVHKIYKFKNIEVTDADTGKRETAQYHLLFGIPVKIIYNPISNLAAYANNREEDTTSTQDLPKDYASRLVAT